MDSLEIDGKEYVSSREAARQHSYTTDYVGQLIRKGSLIGKKVGRTWYVEVASLEKYAGEPAALPKPAMPRTDIFSISEEPDAVAVPFTTSKPEPIRQTRDEIAPSRPLMRYMASEEETLPALPVHKRTEVSVAHIGLDSIVGEAPIEERYLENEQPEEVAPAAIVDDAWGWSEAPKEVAILPKAKQRSQRIRAPHGNSLAFALSLVVAVLSLSIGALSLIAIKEIGFDTTSYSASITSMKGSSNE